MTPLRSRTVAPRLAEGGGTDYERQLLSSARWDGVPAASADRVHAALQAAALTVAAGATASRADGSQHGTASLTKPWALGIVGVGILGAFLASQGPRPPEGSLSPASSSTAPAIALTTAPAPTLIAPPKVTQTETVTEARAAAPVAARSRPRSLAAKKGDVAGAPGTASTAAGLAAEMRAIESIQTLLGWGQAEQAARALAAYHHDFPRGELALEAGLLEVDVALARGDRPVARELARTLLERPGASRYRARLGTLLGSSDGSNPPAR